MSKLERLSVHEDGDRSNRLAAIQDSWTGRESTKFYLSVDVNGSAIFETRTNGVPKCSIQILKLDIDGMIEFLQDAKQFISEEKMVAVLMGKK